MTSRMPAVAGLFYPARAGALRRDLASLLRSAETPPVSAPKVLIVPHAGYVYSGPVAATAYKLLADASATVRRVVMFGPAHRVYLAGMAVPSVDAFTTPLGDVQIDQECRDRLSGLPDVVVSDAAHAQEHCLEVQLPFLQSLLDQFCIVPVLVGQCEPRSVAAALDTVWGGPETLILISSDLSHYHPYAEACEVDAQTSRRILEKSSALSGEEACGAHAINGLMCAATAASLDVSLLDLRNSGDTAGDKDRVVGYGAFSLS